MKLQFVYFTMPTVMGPENTLLFFYVLLTVHLSIRLDNDQLDAYLL